MIKQDKPRTLKQNNSLWLWCEQLAGELNDSGLSMMKVLKPKAEIPWTKNSVKEILFNQMMTAMYPSKTSTTQLSTKELSSVAETLIKHLAEGVGFTTYFPSIETMYYKQLEEK